VVVEIRTGREPFSANATLVRFFAAVNSPVSVQRARRRETLVAHCTHVRLFTCVRKRMRWHYNIAIGNDFSHHTWVSLYYNNICGVLYWHADVGQQDPRGRQFLSGPWESNTRGLRWI